MCSFWTVRYAIRRVCQCDRFCSNRNWAPPCTKLPTIEPPNINDIENRRCHAERRQSNPQFDNRMCELPAELPNTDDQTTEHRGSHDNNNRLLNMDFCLYWRSIVRRRFSISLMFGGSIVGNLVHGCPVSITAKSVTLTNSTYSVTNSPKRTHLLCHTYN